MQEKIWKKIFVRIQEQRANSEKMTRKYALSYLRSWRKALQGHVLWNGEVKHINDRGSQYTTNLDRNTCSCGYFQLAGLLCHHAISTIYKCQEIDDFIHPCCSIEVSKKIYEHCFQPLEDEATWPNFANPIGLKLLVMWKCHEGQRKLTWREKKQRSLKGRKWANMAQL
jgi:hypothetical protein